MKKAKKIVACLLAICMLLPNLSGLRVQAADTNEVVINAVEYGADPTGAKDSTTAIWDALQAAKEAEADGKHVTLEFPTGEYHIYKDKAQQRQYHTSNTNSVENPIKTIGFLIEGHNNLTVDGNGSLFMMHGNMMALAVVKSKDIVLKNFAWDFAVPTVVEMTVTEVGSNYTDYYIADCFPHTVSGNTIRWSSDLSPYTNQPYWSGSGHQPDGRQTYAVVGYHPDDEMTRNYYPSDGPLSNVSTIEEINENEVRVYYSSRSGAQSSNQKEGTVFELCGNAHRETAGAFTWESENVLAEEVDVHFMHGFGWLIQMSKDVYYKRCNLVPRENSGHITVSFADGIHASGAAGQLLFEDCNFANTHDDPLNLHGTFTRVEQRNNDNTLTLKYIHGQQGGFPQYHVGDKVQFFTRDTLESTDGEKTYTVAEIVQDTDQSSDKKTMVIRFAETLPSNLSDRISGQPKYVAENVTYAPAVTIKGCTFKNVATRGVLCTTRNEVIIEDNYFYNMSMATIYLSNDSDEWYESGPIRDMKIRNNVFYIKDIGRTAWNTAPAIYVHPVTKGGGLPAASNPIHKNITIEGNTFYMDLDRVVEAESVENLTFKNNKVFRMNPDVAIDITLTDDTLAAGETTTLTTKATGKKNNGGIDNLFQFKKCKNVVIEGNTYDDGLKLCAVSDQDTINNGLTVKDSDISIVTSASAAVDPVRNIKYATTDPSVATVDAEGRITGVSNGTATVFAYYEWNDTMIRSNYVEVTVEGTGNVETEETVAIVKADGSEADNAEVNMKESATIQFAEKDGKEVTWSVADFKTDAATEKATIAADGTLTAKAEGVVWVKATSTDGAVDRAAVVIYGAGGYGLNPAFSVKRGNDNHSYTNDSITIKAEGGSDLYQSDNTLKNLFLYTPKVAGDNLRTSVKVDNLPVRENGKWDTASFLLYAGDDDYYTIGKKSHYDGFATVKERAQSAAEAGESTTANNSVSSAWLGMSKVGNTIKLEYSLDGQVWTTVGTFEDATFGNDYKIGFGTWGTTREVTFSEFKVGTAEQSYAELEAVAIKKDNNERPTASGLELTVEGTTVTAAYAYTDVDKDAQGATLYRWTYEENGSEKVVVTEDASISVAGIDEISCQVYPVDAMGTPGKASEVKTASFASENTAELHSILVNGAVVFERNDSKDVTVKLPAEVEKVEIGYVSVNNTVGDVSVDVDGEHLEEVLENSDSFLLPAVDGTEITITRGEFAYTLHIEKVGSNVTTVRRIAIDELGLSKLPTKSEKAFYANAGEGQGSGTLKVTVDKAVGKVEIRQNELRTLLETSKYGNTYSADYVLKEGINSLYITAVGADGISKTTYIVSITYSPEGEPGTASGGDTSTTDPADGSNDYTGTITYETGSQENREGVEGPVRLAFDDNASTFWHSEWNPTWDLSKYQDYLWVSMELEEPTVVDAVRYLPRPGGGNGTISGYRIEGTKDGETWTTLTTGTWAPAGQQWQIAEFEPTEVVALRLVATATTSDTVPNKFASAAELRVRNYVYVAAVEKAELEAALEAAQGLVEEKYTAESWEEFIMALENAEIVNADSSATQEEVNDAVAELKAAREALQEKEVPVVNPFEDVKEADYYYAPVLWAVEKGITTGTSATTFSPEDTCTRGAVVTFLWRAAGCPEPEAKETAFVDITAADYYYKAVLWAVEEGITTGTSATTFAPNDGCTRGQVVTFLFRASGEKAPEAATNTFTDVVKGAYYEKAVLWAVEKGITTGTSATTFEPDSNCTRGQIVTFIYRSEK